MAVTLENSGTLTATGGGVEDTLDDTAGAGTYTLHVDTNAMVAGDVLELRIYQMVLSGGTRRVCYYARWDGAQPADDLIKVSVPISTPHSDAGAIRFTLEQSGAGSDKAFPWATYKYS